MTTFELISIIISTIALLITFFSGYKLHPRYICKIINLHESSNGYSCKFVITNRSASYGEIYKIKNSTNKETAYMVNRHNFGCSKIDTSILIYPYQTNSEIIYFKTKPTKGTKLYIYCTSKWFPIRLKLNNI